MSPIDALFTRASRADLFAVADQGLLESERRRNKRRRYFHFGLKDEEFAPPLGWFLSGKIAAQASTSKGAS